MTDLIKSKIHHKSFWEFVEKLKNLRKVFNKIIENKYRTLPRHIKRRPSVLELFKTSKKRIAQETEVLEDINAGVELDSQRGDTPLDSYATQSLDRGKNTDRDQASDPYSPRTIRQTSKLTDGNNGLGSYSIGKISDQEREGLASLRNAMPPNSSDLKSGKATGPLA